MYIYLYIYIYIYIYPLQLHLAVHAIQGLGHGVHDLQVVGVEALFRRRENMVGVNMVLAEFVKFKHGLCKSCGIEWFEGIMLEPYLLQPCFHVAGNGSRG